MGIKITHDQIGYWALLLESRPRRLERMEEQSEAGTYQGERYHRSEQRVRSGHCLVLSFVLFWGVAVAPMV